MNKLISAIDSQSYTLIALVIPAILSSIPLLLFYFLYADTSVKSLFANILAIKIASDISITVIIIYFFSQLCRFFSKEIFQKRYFKEELYMPTTDCLLCKTSIYSQQYRELIVKKIKDDFKIHLHTKDQEAQDENEARKIIVDAVSQIRRVVGKGNLLLKHNIEYGFMRNLIGGSVIAVPLSLFDCVFFYFQKNIIASILSLILFFIYLTLIVFSRAIMDSYGFAYARVLIQEFMGNSNRARKK